MPNVEKGKDGSLTVAGPAGRQCAFGGRGLVIALLAVFWLAFVVAPLQGREHRKREDYGLSFSTEMAFPESEVLQAVEAVVDDGIIQGSFEYNKEKYIEHATAKSSTKFAPRFWHRPTSRRLGTKERSRCVT
jgi:hypothetical protein